MTSLFGGPTNLNVNASGTLVAQTFIPTAGQTVFTLTLFTYTINTNSLLVFVNGKKLRSGIDFYETGSSTFALVVPAVITDTVEVLGFPLSTVQVPASAALVPYVPGGSGALTTDVQSKLRSYVSVFDFMTAAQVADVTSGAGSIDVTTAIQNCINYLQTTGNGGVVYLPPGAYKITNNLTFTWPEMTTAWDLGRVFIQGAGPGATYIHDYRTSVAVGGALTFDFSSFTGAAIDGHFMFGWCGNFSLIKKVNATVISGGTYVSMGTGVGIYGNKIPNGNWKNITITGYDTCQNLIDCLGTVIDNVYYSQANIGLSMAISAFSEPNAAKIDKVTAAACKTWAIKIIGGNPTITGAVIESNGFMGATSGGIYYQNSFTTPLPKGISIYSSYFEDNRGAADIYIETAASTTTSIANIVASCLFARVSSSGYTTNNILLANNGSNTMEFLALDNGFQGYGTYSPSASRKYVASTGSVSNVRVSYFNNRFTSVTEDPTSNSSSLQVPSIGVEGAFRWGGYTIAIPPGGATKFLREDGTWVVPAGGGGATGTVTSVATGTGLLGGPITTTGTISLNLASANVWTANQNFNGANVGTFSGVPSLTSTGSSVGFANSTNSVVLNGATLQSLIDNVVDLGATSYRYKDMYLKNNMVWNSYTILPPGGTTTKFLRDDGTWAVPAGGGGSGTVTSITAGSGLSGGVITTSGTISLNLANSNTWTANQTFNGASIGTYTSVPSVTSTGTQVGLANSTNAVVLSGAAWQGSGDFTVDLGAATFRWNNFYLKANMVWNGVSISSPPGGTTSFLRADGTWAVPSGTGVSLSTPNTWTATQTFPASGGIAISGATPTIGGSGTNLVIGNTAFVPGTGFSPAANSTYYLGGSTLRWLGTYGVDADFSGNVQFVNYTETINAPAAGSAFTVNLANGTIHKLTTNANTTITLPASVSGKSYSVIVAYGGAHTITWAGGGTLKWAGGSAPAATSVSGKFDIFVFTCDGTNTYGRSGGSNF